MGQVRRYTDDAGVFRILGEIRNDGDKHVGGVELTATLYDKKGRVIGSGTTYACTLFVKAGAQSPFEFSPFSTPRPVARTKLSGTYHTLKEGVIVPSLAVLNRSTFFQDGAVHATGEVKNIGTQTASFVEACAATYNKAGLILDTDFTFTAPSTLDVGRKGSFDVRITAEKRAAKTRLFPDAVPPIPQ